jgi:hypothetical protein
MNKYRDIKKKVWYTYQAQTYPSLKVSERGNSKNNRLLSEVI